MSVGIKPFLRWVGGKGKLVPELLKLVPDRYGTYRECFLGGGAFFFALQPMHAVLSDANDELIHAYTIVRDHHVELIIHLQKAARAHSKEHYLFVRSLDPANLDPIARAARFIYLNRTAFNGLYRVNKSGKFNVPWDPGRSGDAEEDRIVQARDALLGYEIYAQDFRKVENAAKEDDFCYFDPPYVPVSATANFTSYTTNGFTHKDQIDLRDLVLRLKRRGVHVLLSNARLPIVRDLYQGYGFEIHETTCRRSVNSDGAKRGAVPEFIIR